MYTDLEACRKQDRMNKMQQKRTEASNDVGAPGPSAGPSALPADSAAADADADHFNDETEHFDISDPAPLAPGEITPDYAELKRRAQQRMAHRAQCDLQDSIQQPVDPAPGVDPSLEPQASSETPLFREASVAPMQA